MSIVEVMMRFRAFLNRRTGEHEMDDEMRFHLEMEAEKNLRSGMSAAEARRAAVLAFGGVDRHQETMRDRRGGRWLEDLGRDLRFAVRTLVRNPGFAIAAMLTLALAIGINSMVFTMVNGILLRPFQVPRPDELVSLWGVDERDHGAIQVGYEDYVDWRDRSGLFSSLAAQMNAPLSMTNGAAEILWSELVTGNYFTVLGLKPELGRFFVAGEEARAGASPYVVLSYDLWQRRFQGDPQVVGRKITIQQRPLEVIGVAPKSFHGIRRIGFWPDLWVPLGVPGTENLLRGRGSGSLTLFGRLRPGRGRAAAFGARAVRVAALRAATHHGFGFDARPGWNRAHPADRLCECRQSVAGARVGAPARDCGASLDRRQSWPHHSSAVHGKRAARADWRPGWTRTGTAVHAPSGRHGATAAVPRRP
jgi:hypothetical protein